MILNSKKSTQVFFLNSLGAKSSNSSVGVGVIGSCQFDECLINHFHVTDLVSNKHFRYSFQSTKGPAPPKKVNPLVSFIFIFPSQVLTFLKIFEQTLDGQQQYSMKVSSPQLEEKIQLVKWEASVPKEKFNLMTIHSLLLDDNPKFKHLKQLIENYNQETSPTRIKLQQSYIQRLFKMLSEVTRIPNSENQMQYLNNIYQWAIMNPDIDTSEPLSFEKARPVTATTKARSQSAYSRATTNRPISGMIQKKAVKNEQLPPLNTINPKIDYSKLKEGEKEVYCGLRSLHPEYQHPRKRLKEYQRKVFYEEDQDSDVEIIQIEPKLVVNQQKLIEDIEIAQEEQVEGEGQGQEGGLGENQENADANIDDIPIEGQEEPAEGQPEEQPQIIDKLRPKVKVYNDPKGIEEYSHKNYYQAMAQLRKESNYKQRRVEEDVEIAQLGAMWAQSKGRAKSEIKRRAESARIVKNKLGIGYQKTPAAQPDKQRENIINFENIAPHNVNSKTTRPVTAFTATTAKTREELIKNAYITGKLKTHVTKYEPGTSLSIPSEFNIVGSSLAIHGDPPKKKTFEEILRQAEERVVRDSNEQVMGVKQLFAKNKISIGANKIAKSISYNDKELSQGERFTGLITGMTMLKNPFIKVSKKKKKKKKK